MVIGVLTVKLSLSWAHSLKDKRQAVKSLIERLKSRYNISVSEAGENDIWKTAVIGICCVSNQSNHIDSIMSKIVNFIENDNRVQITDYSTERININCC